MGGRWRYLWSTLNPFCQLIDFRLTSQRDAKTARAFLRLARDSVRSYQPLTIVTDKAHSYAKVIGEIKGRAGSENAIRNIDRRYLNNRNENDPAALEKRLRPMRRFRTLAGAKAALADIETFRPFEKDNSKTVKPGQSTRLPLSPICSLRLHDR